MSRNSRKSSRPRRIKPVYFVFCEGETEKIYIKYLGHKYKQKFETNVIGNINADKISNFQKRRCFEKNKDKTFLFYDLDTNKLDSLKQIENITLLVSNPCIELWFLLHYKEQTSYIDCKTSIEKLKKYHPKYKKNKIDNKLKKQLEQCENEAINRARHLKKYENPSTTIYTLLEILQNGIIETN